MNITKKQYIFIAIHLIIGLIWIIVTDLSDQPRACYERLLGAWMNYQTYLKVQYYYFLLGNVIFFAKRGNFQLKWFILLEALLIIPVLINLYVSLCSQ